MIKAPFNFVPLNDRVFYPDWSERVSFNLPFRDGVKGEINIKIKALSPIFVRDGENEEDFCHYIDENGNKKYFIPGSSVKGMVRSIVEILSFSKLDFFNDDTYSFRSFDTKSDYKKGMIEKAGEIHCGWLVSEDGKYKIIDAGKPGRISHEEIDKIAESKFNRNTGFAEKFKSNTYVKNHKLAKHKYILFLGTENFKMSDLSFKFSFSEEKNGKRIYKYNPAGGERGTLVFTGQPSPRKEPEGKKPSGKKYEFIFFETDNEPVELDEKVVENFKFAYFDGRDKQPKESEDWGFWKKKLENGEKIPVFFMPDENGKVKHFGLSYMYKLVYDHSVKDGVFPVHKSDENYSKIDGRYKYDLAETVFGTVDENSKTALKGRVYFSDFKALGSPVQMQRTGLVLGSPRASYYPIYIEQNTKQKLKTFMSENFTISGRKRYVVKQGYEIPDVSENGENVKTYIKPLAENTVFEGKLRYFNLKPQELGAILSALTFHNTPGTFHQIGMAKPYGFGKVKIEIDGVEITEYLKEFEKMMREFDDRWLQSDIIKELLTLATEQNGNTYFKYMSVEEHSKYKKTQEYLPRLSKYDSGVNVKTLKSVLNTEEEKEFEKEKELKAKQKIELGIFKEILKTENLKEKLNRFKSFVNSVKSEDVKNKIKEEIEKIENEMKRKEIEEKIKVKMKALEEILSLKNVSQKKKQLENFVKSCEFEDILQKAREELSKFGQNAKKNFEESLKTVKNAKTLKKFLQQYQKELKDGEKIQKLISHLDEVVKNLKSKEKKKFIKESGVKSLASHLMDKIEELLK